MMSMLRTKPRILRKKIATASSYKIPQMPRSKIDLFKELGQYNAETGCTRWVRTTEFVDGYKGLVLGNGGSWCRRSMVEHQFKVATVKKNGDISILWDATTEEEQHVNQDYAEYCSANKIKSAKGINIFMIKFFGHASKETHRPIRDDILATIHASACVVCGTSATVCDHKNDLYNDPRVLSKETQRLDDFQPLCNHCNLQKRQVAKKTRETGKRYGATSIAQLAIFGIDFLSGDESYDPNDPNAMVGTYWYDPVAFTAELKRRLSS